MDRGSHELDEHGTGDEQGQAADPRRGERPPRHADGLLVEAKVPDADTLVDSLLAPLAPEVYQYQRYQRGRLPQHITDSLNWQARRLLDP